MKRTIRKTNKNKSKNKNFKEKNPTELQKANIEVKVYKGN